MRRALVDAFAKDHHWFDGDVLAGERLPQMAAEALGVQRSTRTGCGSGWS